MKKIALMGVLALSMGFVSCDDVQDSNARPQENPQLPIFEAEGVTISPVEAAADPVDLAAEKNVAVAVVETQDFPETYTIHATVELSADDSFSKVSTFEAVAEENQLIADAESLNAAFRTETGLSPDAKTVYLRFAAYAVNGTNVVRLGGPDFYYGPVSATYIPVPLDIFVDQAYYLVIDDEVENAIKLDHSGTNVYDDPVFSIAYTVSDDQSDNGFIWKVISGTAYEYAKANGWALPTEENSQFGPEEEDATEGKLVPNEEGSDSESGCVYELIGQYVMTFNMLDFEYGFKTTFPYLYTPGSSNGWNFDNCQLLGTTDFLTYSGYVNVVDMFKFTSEDAWSAPYNLGLDAWVDTTPVNGWLSGTLRNKSNDNIDIKKLDQPNGLYYCEVLISSLEFKIQHIETIGVIGGFNGWAESVALTPSADNLVWTGEVTLTGSDQGWKFRANNDWAINLGGSMDDLVGGGDNLPDPGAGVYTVRLDLSKLPYSCTLTAK